MKHVKSRKRLACFLFCFMSVQHSYSFPATSPDGRRAGIALPQRDSNFLKRKRRFCPTAVTSLQEPTAEENASSDARPQKKEATSITENQKKRFQKPVNNRKNFNQPPPSPSNWKNNNRSNNNSNRYSNNNVFNSARALNQQVVACQSAKEVLDLTTSSKLMMTLCAGGGTMNSINFSTSLHRIARHVVANYSTRAQVLADPRFALLLCAMAEAMAGLDYTQPLSAVAAKANGDTVSLATDMPTSTKWTFKAREMSNIAWALAKLRLIPPQSIFPMAPLATSADASSSFLLPIHQQLIETSLQVRSQLLEAARRRKVASDNDQGGDDDQAGKPLWITTLSQLAAIILDAISYSVLAQTNMAFQSQEWANLLWAMATTQRANPLVFDNFALRLMEGMERQLQQQKRESNQAESATAVRPQECSNSIWAFATAQMTGPTQEKLLIFIANLMEDPAFVETFKPQEMSNTAWSVATLLALKKQQQKSISKEEEQATLRIFRHVAKALISRTDEWKSQELSNSVWAMATVGFGQRWVTGSLRSRASEAIDLNDYLVIASDQGEEDEKLLEKTLESLSKSSLPRLSLFRSQGTTC